MDAYITQRPVTATTSDFASVPLRKISNKRQLVEAYASLLLFMVVYWARPEDWIPGLASAPLAKIAAVLALIAFALSYGKVRQRVPPEVVYVFLLIGQLFATVPMSSVWKGGAFLTTLDFAKVGLIVLVLVMTVNSAQRLRRILFIQAASVAAISAVAVLKGRSLGNRLDGVLNGNYSNPNDLALAIGITLPLCFALLLLSESNLRKAVWALAMAIMVYAVLLTASRGGFITLAIAGAVGLWGFAIRGRRPYLLALAVVAGIVLWASSGGMLGDRLVGTFDSKDEAASAYGSFQARQELLRRSIEVTITHPLFGVGPGNFQVMSGNWHGTHNSYTQISSEGGVPALILFVMILWCGFKNVRATKRLARKNAEFTLIAQGLTASLAGFVVGAFFSSNAYQFFPYFLVAYTRAFLWIAKESTSRPLETAGQRTLVRTYTEPSWSTERAMPLAP